MPNPYNGSRKGKRGNSSLRPSRKPDFEPKHADSPTAVIPDQVGKFWDCMDGENKADHLIPRSSLTHTQHLDLYDPAVEFEPLKDTRRLQQATIAGRKVMTETTDPKYRLAWKGDTTLLRRGKPDNYGEKRGTAFTFEQPRTKERTRQIDIKDKESILRIVDQRDPLDGL